MALHSGRSPQGGGRRYAHVPQCRCRCALATCGRRPSQPQSSLLRKCLLPSCFASFSALFPLLSQGLTSFSIIPTFRNRTVAFLSPGIYSGRSPQGGGRRYAHVPQCRCRCALATCGRRPSQPQSLLLRKCLLPSCFASFSALFPLLSQGLTSFSIIPTFRNRTVAFLSPGI